MTGGEAIGEKYAIVLSERAVGCDVSGPGVDIDRLRHKVGLVFRILGREEHCYRADQVAGARLECASCWNGSI